jgi:hypothetical protein
MDFYKSRKFAYAAGTLLAAIVLMVLPSLVELDPATRDMLDEMLPLIFVLGFLVIGGHTATDLIATWREGVSGKNLQEALHDLIDAVVPGSPSITVVATGDDPEATASAIAKGIARSIPPVREVNIGDRPK